ncbi:2-polyprenyl-6-methoxyphenol hydroxylase-like FAD-dependent oxidoreductase [Psychromicrobium silvestre]|uniref:2-polyprenyl-6-methoxyphenol hydroxylase-like FAD-dependent oxidoreductase n=1 Tax=Psychromicrobium silvestre TaxID=1645614 RepID=A0A7Y9LRV1_9MICC|nr:NAD(P)/FAD-dependent oxidoreductase [Psychromicrobium silvestre]NYE94437.1 2-polyprenyl-6-methoxyphenol hydroxylase-like FAD-dependent oxidoreductase [Psychromicrobium silvestre]
MTHALIIGAGVAGPVLSMALSRVGIENTVYERDLAGAEQRGSWLSFQANGMDALRAIDAADPVTELGFEVETISFVNGKGRSLGRMPMAAQRSDGQLSLMMPRSDLYVALGQLARERGADVHYGKQLVRVEELADGGVRAHFSDGTNATGDLLIGCDGLRSQVRTLIDPQAQAPRYVPVLNTGGYIPNFQVDVPQGEFRMQFGTRSFFAWAPTPDGGTVWFANPPMLKEPERGVLSDMSDAEWRRWLHELMEGDSGPAHEIIDAAPGPLVGWATYDLPAVEHWHNGRNLVIIGDAAHAVSPSAGQGASMALEDAVELAKCLRDCPDLPSAFETFQALRKARTAKIVKYGHRSSNSKAAGPVARVIRDALLPLIFGRAEKDGGKSMMWLQGHHIDFDEVVTPVR